MNGKRLAEKVAVVTGASGGIGRGIAERLAEEGASIIVADLNTKAGADTAADLQRKYGGDAFSIPVDVSDEMSVDDLIQRVTGRYPGIHILVNSAGVSSKIPVLEDTMQNWQKTVAINLGGTFLVSQRVGRLMKDQGQGGSIINISSISAEIAIRHNGPYSASKGGVRMLTKSFAVDLAEYGIRVNAVGPGICDTEMTAKLLSEPENRKRLLSRIPLARFGTVEDIAAATAFLASDDSSYITGSSLYVDGGLLSAH